MRIASAPLFRCPIFDGAADPCVLWNPLEKQWFLYYTARRANVPGPGLAWVHGTPIGIASSPDGQNWLFRGFCEGLEFEKGHNTFWAPDILWHEGRFHAYISIVRGIPIAWTGDRRIAHYTSENGFDWEFQSVLPLNSNRLIDASVFPLPAGGWRMWFKDEDHHSHTFIADSPDLYNWQWRGESVNDESHEGTNVFELGGYYWMITDPWRGLGVYRSTDLENWEKQGYIMSEPGKRPDDGVQAGHADVVAFKDHAFIFYFTHPDRLKGQIPPEHEIGFRRSSIQVARLEILDGILICHRNEPFDFYLPPQEP